MSWPFRVEFFECECHSYDHVLRIAYDPTETDLRAADIWVDAHFPSGRSLWQRMVLAYKYITRTGTMDYSYGTWILKHEDYARMRNFFTEYDIYVHKLKQGETEENGDQQKDGV